MRIGVISDTHGLLREEVRAVLKGCDVILHGGDVDSRNILEELEKIAPLHVVRGNMDEYSLPGLPESLKVQIGGLRFFLIHDRAKIREDLSDRDIVIFGHSHRYEETRNGEQLWLNPGSCGPKRFFLPVTMAVLEVGEDGSLCVERIEISAKSGASQGLEAGESGRGKMDRRELVKAVMKDMSRGKTTSAIAERYGISRELAEQICRLYVTHPGIDAEGIINKMG